MKHLQGQIRARDWIRTSTSFRTPPPEDGASTNFATWAECKYNPSEFSMNIWKSSCEFTKRISHDGLHD
jgi:hypothetical protein